MKSDMFKIWQAEKDAHRDMTVSYRDARTIGDKPIDAAMKYDLYELDGAVEDAEQQKTLMVLFKKDGLELRYKDNAKKGKAVVVAYLSEHGALLKVEEEFNKMPKKLQDITEGYEQVYSSYLAVKQKNEDYKSYIAAKLEDEKKRKGVADKSKTQKEIGD